MQWRALSRGSDRATPPLSRALGIWEIPVPILRVTPGALPTATPAWNRAPGTCAIPPTAAIRAQGSQASQTAMLKGVPGAWATLTLTLRRA